MLTRGIFACRRYKMSLDVIELLGLVVSAIAMLYTLLSRFSVAEELERAKALREAAQLFDELERAEHDFHDDKGVVYSTDALVGYKKSLRTLDRKSTRLNSSHVANSYAVFC